MSATFTLLGFNFQFSEELIEIIKEEVNVREVVLGKKFKSPVLDTEITVELKLEGQAREIIRLVQEMRKEAGYDIDNRIQISYDGALEVFERFRDMIAKETLAENIEPQNQKLEELKVFDLEKEFNLDGEKLKLRIRRLK